MGVEQEPSSLWATYTTLRKESLLDGYSHYSNDVREDLPPDLLNPAFATNRSNDPAEYSEEGLVLTLLKLRKERLQREAQKSQPEP